MDAYCHRQGSQVAPKHTEYEVAMHGVREIIAAHNATVRDNFLQVIDEAKPVLVLMTTVSGCLFRLDKHMMPAASPAGCKTELRPLKTSDIGAVTTETMKGMELQYIKLRIGDESYWLCGQQEPNEPVSGIISMNDLLGFIAGDIPWSALRGRSYICQREQRKELSRQELIKKLKAQLRKNEMEILLLHGLVFIEEQANVQQQMELKSVQGNLSKIPRWIRRMFGAGQGI